MLLPKPWQRDRSEKGAGQAPPTDHSCPRQIEGPHSPSMGCSSAGRRWGRQGERGERLAPCAGTPTGAPTTHPARGLLLVTNQAIPSQHPHTQGPPRRVASQETEAGTALRGIRVRAALELKTPHTDLNSMAPQMRGTHMGCAQEHLHRHLTTQGPCWHLKTQGRPRSAASPPPRPLSSAALPNPHPQALCLLGPSCLWS